jgi:hypothetical protein
VQSYAYVMLLLILLVSPLYVKSSLPQTACVIECITAIIMKLITE